MSDLKYRKDVQNNRGTTLFIDENDYISIGQNGTDIMMRCKERTKYFDTFEELMRNIECSSSKYKFSKQDLQPLYVVQLRAGDYGMVIDISTGRYIQLRKKEGYIQEFLPLKDYLNDLTYIDPYDSNLDIICVWGFSLFKEEALTISTEARPLLWAS